MPMTIDGLQARLIQRPDDEENLSFVWKTDARTALARGLREYFASAEIAWADGRSLSFERVLHVWAEPEVPAKLPCLVIVTSLPAKYEDSHFTPTTVRVGRPQDQHYVRIAAGMKQEFQVQVWTTDPVERSGFVAMVEDMLEPTDWMTGMRLELPYYFGVRATYEKMTVSYDDSPDDAQRRWRRAVFDITGHIPQVVPVGALPMLKPRILTTVDDGR